MVEQIDNSPEGHLYHKVFGIQIENFPPELVLPRQETVAEVLDEFPPRTRKIMELRNGFGDNNQPINLEEVGKRFSVTRERIRQIEAKTIRFLRHPNKSFRLGLFLPLEENQVGRLLWDTNYLYYLNQQLDPVNILAYNLGSLDLPKSEFIRLQQIDGLSHVMSNPHFLYRLFTTHVLQVPAPDLSVIREHTERLQEKLISA